ncbi:MAG: bifunctional DNA primase/polymerase [Anaerolineae bacterium]|nr:bifunctional DNA primase/polymerase [Anaerolineae bacterium]
MTATLDEARCYVQSGFSVIPLWQVPGDTKRSKQPAISSWKEYQNRLPIPEELDGWFGNDNRPRNLALITGYVSGNVVALDFDVPGSY